jgi:hypothetical protein
VPDQGRDAIPDLNAVSPSASIPTFPRWPVRTRPAEDQRDDGGVFDDKPAHSNVPRLRVQIAVIGRTRTSTTVWPQRHSGNQGARPIPSNAGDSAPKTVATPLRDRAWNRDMAHGQQFLT